MKSNPPIPVGQLVAGKYRLLEVIGEGGMGVVYLAEHELIEKRVALKVLRPEYSSRAELVSRFQQEAISASRIKHPNVLDVFDFGQLEDGSFFLAMEYLKGHDLSHELADGKTLTPVRAIQIALQATRALAAAHGRGVVHRDMKPENVFLHSSEDGDETVKIVDFGIAQLKSEDKPGQEPQGRRRLTRTGMIFGTPEYMSPEQAAGRPVDLRVDVYALGVILYEMFTGAVPFTSDSFMAVLSAHMNRPIPPMRSVVPELVISEELEAVVYKALEKEPDQRFQSMKELAAALQATPEGQVASGTFGLMPMPEINPGTFRSVQTPGLPTAPQFGRPPPDASPSMRPSGSGEIGPSVHTLVDGTSDVFRVSELPLPPGASTVPPKSRAALWVLGALFLGGLGVTGAAIVFGPQLLQRFTHRAASPSGAPPASVVANPAPPPSLPAPVAAASLPLPEPSSSSPAVSSVTLSITTLPPGAVVSKDGFQVCDTTPCTATIPRGAAVELVATKGTMRGTAKVLGQRDQGVSISLIAPTRPAPAQPRQQLCEVVVDGLKILRPCR